MRNIFDYENIGEKIKLLVKTTFWVSAILIGISSFVYSVGFIADGMILIGILILIGSFFLISYIWVGTWITYGFAEIIDKLVAIEANTRKDTSYVDHTNKQYNTTASIYKYQNGATRQKFKNALEQGIISEEEYKRWTGDYK